LTDRWQRKLLLCAIDHYERTSTYRGENTVSQTIRVRPDEVCPSYFSDLADVKEIGEFERSIKAFVQTTPFRIEYKDRRLKSEFAAICLPADRAEPLLYDLAGRIPKRDRHAAEIPLYRKFFRKANELDTSTCAGVCSPVALFCQDQMNRLKEDKNSRFGDGAEDVLRFTLTICTNPEDILIRELSIRVFGDSKRAEKNSLLGQSLYILRTYGRYEFLPEDFENPRDYDDAVLAEYHVYRNPTYVNFNGNARIVFENGTELRLRRGVPMAVRSDQICGIRSIIIEDSRFMTIENLTSYNRMVSGGPKDTFLIYLAGYHNKVKQDFLTLIREENPQIREWLHFGDIDPDGFYILENLRRKTGIDFIPWHMGVEELENYRSYGKALNENDRTKAAGLIAKNKYNEVLLHMLGQNIKLEQEIVSWKTGTGNQIEITE